MKTYTSLVILVLSVLFFSCNDNEIPEPNSEVTETVVAVVDEGEMADPRIGPDGNSFAKSSEAVADTVNHDNYEIIFTDYFSDPFYLNLQNSNAGIYLYRGIWTTSGKTYDCIVLYDSNSNTLSLNGYYRGDYIMMYHLTWSSTNYFDGRYSWLYAGGKGTSRLSRMYINISKGEFPGSNM